MPPRGQRPNRLEQAVGSRRGSGPRSARPSGSARALRAIAGGSRPSAARPSAASAPTASPGRGSKPVCSFSSSKRLRRLPVADDARGVRLDPEHDVLDHGPRGHQRDLLGDRRDARVEGVPRRSGTRRAGPSTSSSPSSGRWTPPMTLASVDLPAPFSPTRPWTLPALERRSRRRPAPGRRRSACETPRASTRGRASPCAPSSSPVTRPWSRELRRLPEPRRHPSTGVDSIAVLRLEVRLRRGSAFVRERVLERARC